MRALILLALVSACGAPVELGETEERESDGSEAMVGEELREADETDEPVAEYGEKSDPVPQCIYFSPDAVDRFPGLRDATHNALARWWRWYPEGGEECAVRVILSDVPKVAQGWYTETISGVRINPEGPIVDGDTCSGNRALLIDVMTHELGHVFGFGHFGDGAMAATHEACEPVEPTDDEIAVANGCGTWGPPDVADCP